MVYTQPLLAQLLEQQSQSRGQSNLFKKGTFVIQWRAKVGSFPHPDGETMISAGEPCGAWKTHQQQPRNDVVKDHKGRDKTIHRLEQYLSEVPQLPINGYIPGSSIRGLVRSWAKQHPEYKQRMEQLLGYQNDTQNKIHAGKIEFLDAYPEKPTRVTLDIVNPQEKFQVYHDENNQSNPSPLYTLGSGKQEIPITIAIRGIPNKTTSEEVAEVWGWVEQALSFYGVGSRTASGYGAIQKPGVTVTPPGDYRTKTLSFSLYSQGCYGANQRPGKGNEELRPSHWRGWLRSWVLRFLLGVMSEANAQRTLGELLGTIGADDNANAIQGCVRIEMEMKQGKTWGERSSNSPYFYVWKGKLEISAPSDILNNIILPIVKFAASVGGVGRGWRRPLHIFMMEKRDKSEEAVRGSYLKLTHSVKDKRKLFALHPNKANIWEKNYQNWLDSVQSRWSNRIEIGINDNLTAEVFSPNTCAVYTVAAPVEEPVDFKEKTWNFTNAVDTRGDGMNLIYQPRYKKKKDVGGNAGNGGTYCSWVSIRRVNVSHPDPEEDTDCQETVCLFLGGVNPHEDQNHLRSRFLQDLANRPGATHLFGVQP